jgi:hypothetical protein
MILESAGPHKRYPLTVITQIRYSSHALGSRNKAEMETVRWPKLRRANCYYICRCRQRQLAIISLVEESLFNLPL